MTNFVATPGALEAIADAGDDPRQFIRRHLGSDWGDVSKADAKANDAALASGERLLSSYRTTKGVRIWVLTEAVGDYGTRATTTILLPQDY
jgi:hypothetical protein